MRFIALVLLLPACGAVLSTEHYCVGPAERGDCYASREEAQRASDARSAERRKAELERIAAQAAADENLRKARQAELDLREAEREEAAALAEVGLHERRLAEQREAAKREARDATAKARLDDPAFAGPALSALLCERERDLQGYRDELARVARQERAAGGGIVEVGARSEIGADIVAAQDEIAAYRAGLARLGAKRAPCAAVQPVLDCLLRSQCSASGARDSVSVREVADVARYAPARYGVQLR